MSFTLHASKRIKSKKQFNIVFSQGSRFTIHPFHVVYATNNQPKQNNIKFAFSVPKKRFKKAVDRNLVRRRMKEAVRLHHKDLENCLRERGLECYIVFVYISKDILSFEEIEHKIILSLQRLKEQYA